MADATSPTPAPAPSPGLAIYAAENGGEFNCPVLLLIDEDNDYKMVDVFISAWDVNTASSRYDNYFSWPKKMPPDGESFKPEIASGELTHVGPMPRKHVFYRRG